MLNKFKAVFYKILFSFYTICKYLKDGFNSFLLKIIGLVFFIIFISFAITGRMSFASEILLLVGALTAFIFYLSSVSFLFYKNIHLFEDEIKAHFLSSGITVDNIDFIRSNDKNPFIQSDEGFSLGPILKIGGLIFINSTIYRRGIIQTENNKQTQAWIRIDFKFNKILNISYITDDFYPV